MCDLMPELVLEERSLKGTCMHTRLGLAWGVCNPTRSRYGDVHSSLTQTESFRGQCMLWSWLLYGHILELWDVVSDCTGWVLVES